MYLGFTFGRLLKLLAGTSTDLVHTVSPGADLFAITRLADREALPATVSKNCILLQQVPVTEKATAK